MKHLKRSFFYIFTAAFIAVVVTAGIFSYEYFQADQEQSEITESSSGAETENQAETSLETEEKEDAKAETALSQKVTFYKENENLENKISVLMEDMTLEEKIGQMLVIGFESDQVDAHAEKMINEYQAGGIILYDRNMKTPKQVASLTNDLQKLAKKNGHQIPLMVTIDQEGGQIVRMKDQVSPIPSQQELGLKGNTEQIYKTAYRNGTELTSMGVHVNFAPVLDLSETDSRSFGTDGTKTSTFGEQVVTGLADAGMVATLKHFPGNGRSNIDPHVETSSVEANRLDLENKDILPFKNIIDNVDHNRFFVMVTHLKYPAYDKENPASISPVIIQDLLRNQLGYTGIVVTDDLEMGAVNKYFTYEDLGYKAVQSGADLLLVCHTLENQEKVFNGILNAVKEGKLSEDQINEAVKRILAYKIQSIKTVEVDTRNAEEMVGKS